MIKINANSNKLQTNNLVNTTNGIKREKSVLSDYFTVANDNGQNQQHRMAQRLVSASLKNDKSTNKMNRSESDKYLIKHKHSAQNLTTRQFLINRSTIRLFDKVPQEHMPPLHIVNQDEVKKQFLENKIPPVLKFKADDYVIQNILFKHSKPSYQYFFKAKHILDLVKTRFQTGASYFDANFGPKITSKESIDIIAKYLIDNKITDDISINFAPGLTCSGRIISYHTVKNKPETRKFSIWINDGEENQFLRRTGILSLCDHEIGTHYYRSYNDGLQVWYASRKNFGLRPTSSVELTRTEEGLAALHTVMNANLKFLFLPALFYYIACMADTLTFEQLYNHMEIYMQDPEERWKLVTRVKRGISDPNQIGCYSRDQSYFEGAVNILENLDSIDFILLMSGKICVDELILVKKVAKIDKLKLPKFLENIQEYKERLRYIGVVNGLISPKSRRLTSKNQINDNSTTTSTTTTNNNNNSAVNTKTNNNNELIIKDMVTDSDIVIENLKTNRSSATTTTTRTTATTSSSSSSIVNLDDSKQNHSSNSNITSNSNIITITANTTNTNTQLNSHDTDSFNDSLMEDYNIMYNLNQKCEQFDSDEIRNYISKEIAANTKNVPINKPFSSSINNNSSFCMLL